MGWRLAALILLLSGCSGAAGWLEPRVKLEAPAGDVFVVRGRAATVEVTLAPEGGLAEVTGARAQLDAAGAPRGVEVVFAL